ncbi:MAG: hypothetical protein KAF27_01330 [Porphyrobacter sp.]|nr:hypothetical protein [Porphyrobacter sp.]
MAALWLAAPLEAQQSFELPPARPTPTPAPAGPADERAGIAIPPRSQPSAPAPAPAPPPSPSVQAAPAPAATPVVQPLPSAPPSASPSAPARTPTPRPSGQPAPAQRTDGTPAPAPSAPASAAASLPETSAPLPAPAALPSGTPLPADPALASPPAGPDLTEIASQELGALPAWWLYAALGLGAAILVLAGGAWAWRRRRPRTLRLAAPVAGAAGDTASDSAPLRLDLALDITSASRSVMMFTIQYRLTIANRCERAVNDLNAAARLVCAKSSVAGGAAGAAQGLESIARIGPHQARSITGTLQLPLAAITPLRQGQTPLFIPLVHVTLEGENLPADTRTFVIGTPSASGRVHPIPLDQPPGGIAGLVAQLIAPAATPSPAAAA